MRKVGQMLDHARASCRLGILGKLGSFGMVYGSGCLDFRALALALVYQCQLSFVKFQQQKTVVKLLQERVVT
jgi:hypothetical protein